MFLAMDEKPIPWSRRTRIFAKTRERLKMKTSAEWLATHARRHIWCGPVYWIEDPYQRSPGQAQRHVLSNTISVPEAA